VEIPAVLSHASIPGDESHIPQDLVRISVGIEDIHDLLADLRCPPDTLHYKP
jgi:cystathionine beta-lyase/cystathionine gamma-synthase